MIVNKMRYFFLFAINNDCMVLVSYIFAIPFLFLSLSSCGFGYLLLYASYCLSIASEERDWEW